MASRTILQRRKSLLGLVKQPHCLARRLCSEHVELSKVPYSEDWSFQLSPTHVNHGKKEDSHPQVKHAQQYTVMGKYVWHSFCGIPNMPWEIRIPGQGIPLGFSWAKEYAHYLSTVSAGERRPELEGNGDTHREVAIKKNKQPSPEECDQAVEGLSSAKAKAKAKAMAKKLQESQQGVMFILKRMWAILLEIGPALRAVAWMSREDWGKKIRHWRDELKSATQHYWLGIKLLWADIRISLRLLSKLANGKTLSRRERQQLTRTTADIFRLVPFAVFIIVPFMELLLPVFLKLFPNMLPSTFQDKKKEQFSRSTRICKSQDICPC